MGRKKLDNKVLSIGLELGLIDKVNKYADKEAMLKSHFVEKLIKEYKPNFQVMDPIFFGRNRKRKAVGLALSQEVNDKFQQMRQEYGVTMEVLLAALMADYESKLANNGTERPK